MSATSSPPPQRVGAGIAFKLGAVVAMGIMAALVKMAAERGAHTLEIVFFRSFFALVPVLAYIGVTRGWAVLRTRRPVGHLVRSAVGISGMLCGFAALPLMPLSEFTAINFAAPLFITALSWPVLGEKVGAFRWAAVLVGFVGVIVMLRPDPAHLIGLGPVLALGQALGTAGAMLAIRQLGATERGATIVFYFLLAGTAVGAVGLPFVWTQPTPEMLLILVLCGLSGGAGQLLLTQAFRLAPAAAVAPFEYAALLWACALGFGLWGEIPSTATIAGGCIVAVSGLFIAWRETRRGRRA